MITVIEPNIVVTPDIKPEGSTYDLFIAAAGYETRSRYIAEMGNVYAHRKVAYTFPVQRVLAYAENVGWYEKAGYALIEAADREFSASIRELLEAVCAEDEKTATVAVDVSSLSRLRIATLINEIKRCAFAHRITVDFLYNIARYSAYTQTEAPNTYVGPAIAAFAGWPIEPDRPSVAIFGLGYEPDKALGAVEHVQPTKIWAFVPMSGIAEYTADLHRANETLLESLPAANQVQYRVEDAYSTFTRLEELVHGVESANNVILFPFGPKIFSVASMLVALLHPSIAVWRVSAGHDAVPSDRLPSDTICGLRALMAPRGVSVIDL